MTPPAQARTDELYRRRLQSMQAVDDGIAKLIGTLRDTGQLDNTYIVFTSDNGFHLGQFRMEAGKQTPYDFDIHVPFVVRGERLQRFRALPDNILVHDLSKSLPFSADSVDAVYHSHLLEHHTRGPKRRRH